MSPIRNQARLTAKIAAPYRKALQVFLKKAFPTSDDQRQLAQSLDRSVDTIRTLIFQGEGGLDLVLACLHHAIASTNETKIKPDDLMQAFSDFLKRNEEPTPSDKLFNQWKENLSEETLFFYMSLFDLHIHMIDDFNRKKTRKKKLRRSGPVFSSSKPLQNTTKV